MERFLSTYEASLKYGLTGSYLRRLMRNGRLTGQQVKLSKTLTVYLIEEKSLKKYINSAPKPGRPPRK